MLQNIDGVSIEGLSYKLVRDSIIKRANVPFDRVLIYQLEIDLPIDIKVYTYLQ